MASPIDLTCNEVIKFLKNKGGTSTNLELVSHFRKILNDPLHQVEMRLRFKDIINSIANVAENQGTKCISLKEKYLNCTSFEPELSLEEMNKERLAESPEAQTNSSYQPYWRYRLSCSGKSAAPAPGGLSLNSISPELKDYKRRCSYPQSTLSNENDSQILVSQHSFPPSSGRNVQDKRRAGVFDSLWLDETENYIPDNNYNSVFEENISIPYEDNDEESVKWSKTKLLPHLNACQPSDTIVLVNKHRSFTAPSCSSPFISTISSSQNLHQTESHHNQDHNKNQTINELINNCDNVTSSFLPHGEIQIKQEDICTEEGKLQPEVPNALSEQDPPVVLTDGQPPDDEYRAHSKSVKERAEQIERMSALEATPPRKSSPHSSHKYNRYRDFGSRTRIEKISDDDTSVVSTLDSKLRRQWFVKAAQSDYHGLLSLLKVEPRLAGLRDFMSGFTALHWAAKNGNAEVVKLIAGSHKVSPDLKSHGGYTCIHLAALYKHKPIVELLVKTYGADPTIRDNSGKRADQYPSDYLSVSAGSNRHTICNRHYKSITIPVNQKLIRVRQPETQSGTFIRIGSLNLKVSMAAPGFGSSKGRRIQRLKTWGSADSVAESWSSSGTSDRMSFRRKKKAKKKNVELQHRGSMSSKHDSDSDGAYGFHS